MHHKKKDAEGFDLVRAPHLVGLIGRYTMFLIVLVGLSFMGSPLIPALHRNGCAYHAENPEHVFSCGMAVLWGETQQKTGFSIVHPGRWYGALFEEHLDSLRILPPATQFTDSQDSLAQIWCVLYEPTNLVYVGYVTKPIIRKVESLGNLARSKEHLYATAAFVLPYNLHANAQENLAEFASFIRSFATRNKTLFPRLNADTVIARTNKIERSHFSFVFRDSGNLRRIALGVLIAILGIHFHFVLAGVFWKRLLKRCTEYHRHGFPARPPRFIQCFLAPSMLQYAIHYTEQLKTGQKLYWQRIAEAEKKRNDIKRQLDRMQSFMEEIERFQTELSEDISLPDKVFASIDSLIKLAMAEHLPLNRRRRHLEEARQLTYKYSAREELREKERREVYEKNLLEKVESLRFHTLSIEKQQDVRVCLKNYEQESPKRLKRRIYWLEQALAAANIPIEKEQELPRRKEQVPITQKEKATLPQLNQDSLITLLDIQGVLPSSTDLIHASSIILQGLLKPGQRGRSYFNERYRTAQYVRRDVASKLQKQFDPDLYEQALSWLVEQRVILIPKRKRHQVVYSLNPHVATAQNGGKPIIQRILNFKDELLKLVST